MHVTMSLHQFSDVKVKIKVVNLYSASSCTTYTSNACKHRLAHWPARQPSQLYKGPHLQ